MKLDLMKKLIAFLVVIVIFLPLDLMVKELAASQLKNDIEVIPGFWKFHLTYNDDMGFSLLKFTETFLDKKVKMVLIIVLQFIGVSLAAYFYFAKGDFLNPWYKRLPLALICAGGLGNALDRIIRGHVVDYILWYFNDFSWPVFNLADVYSVIGIGFLIIFIFFKRKLKEDKNTINSAENEKTD